MSDEKQEDRYHWYLFPAVPEKYFNEHEMRLRTDQIYCFYDDRSVGTNAVWVEVHSHDDRAYFKGLSAKQFRKDLDKKNGTPLPLLRLEVNQNNKRSYQFIRADKIVGITGLAYTKTVKGVEKELTGCYLFMENYERKFELEMKPAPVLREINRVLNGMEQTCEICCCEDDDDNDEIPLPPDDE